MKVLPHPGSINTAARVFNRDVAVIHRIIRRRPEIATKVSFAGCRLGFAHVIDMQAMAEELEKRPRRPRPPKRLTASGEVGHAVR